MSDYDPRDATVKSRKKRPKNPGQLAMFPAARSGDPGTSKAAAHGLAPHLGKIQTLVLSVYRAAGPMSARVAERREEFEDYGFSTIRKRISELAAAGHLEEFGIDKTGRAPCTIYRYKEPA